MDAGGTISQVIFRHEFDALLSALSGSMTGHGSPTDFAVKTSSLRLLGPLPRRPYLLHHERASCPESIGRSAVRSGLSERAPSPATETSSPQIRNRERASSSPVEEPVAAYAKGTAPKLAIAESDSTVRNGAHQTQSELVRQGALHISHCCVASQSDIARRHAEAL